MHFTIMWVHFFAVGEGLVPSRLDTIIFRE